MKIIEDSNGEWVRTGDKILIDYWVDLGNGNVGEESDVVIATDSLLEYIEEGKSGVFNVTFLEKGAYSYEQ